MSDFEFRMNQSEKIPIHGERDAHWRDLLQYDEDPETAGLSVLERVKRLANLIGFVDGSPAWKACMGHMVAVAKNGSGLTENEAKITSIALNVLLSLLDGLPVGDEDAFFGRVVEELGTQEGLTSEGALCQLAVAAVGKIEGGVAE
jgi:hypothetical protein